MKLYAYLKKEIYYYLNCGHFKICNLFRHVFLFESVLIKIVINVATSCQIMC